MSTEWSVARAPEPHARFLARASERLQEDERLIGLAIGGSYLTSSTDEFSDLDLVIAVEPAVAEAVLAERRVIAERLGPLLAAFTGEHVGEPRLLICLYGPPLLHVDLKFVSLSDAAIRIEDPAIVWERERRFSQALRAAAPSPPRPDLQWLEDQLPRLPPHAGARPSGAAPWWRATDGRAQAGGARAGLRRRSAAYDRDPQHALLPGGASCFGGPLPPLARCPRWPRVAAQSSSGSRGTGVPHRDGSAAHPNVILSRLPPVFAGTRADCSGSRGSA